MFATRNARCANLGASLGLTLTASQSPLQSPGLWPRHRVARVAGTGRNRSQRACGTVGVHSSIACYASRLAGKVPVWEIGAFLLRASGERATSPLTCRGKPRGRRFCCAIKNVHPVPMSCWTVPSPGRAGRFAPGGTGPYLRIHHVHRWIHHRDSTGLTVGQAAARLSDSLRRAGCARWLLHRLAHQPGTEPDRRPGARAEARRSADPVSGRELGTKADRRKRG